MNNDKEFLVSIAQDDKNYPNTNPWHKVVPLAHVLQIVEVNKDDIADLNEDVVALKKKIKTVKNAIKILQDNLKTCPLPTSEKEGKEMIKGIQMILATVEKKIY